MSGDAAVAYLSDSILYLSSMLRNQPRQIDGYIDYFGERPVQSRARRLRASAVRALKSAGSRLRRRRSS